MVRRTFLCSASTSPAEYSFDVSLAKALEEMPNMDYRVYYNLRDGIANDRMVPMLMNLGVDEGKAKFLTNLTNYYQKMGCQIPRCDIFLANVSRKDSLLPTLLRYARVLDRTAIGYHLNFSNTSLSSLGSSGSYEEFFLSRQVPVHELAVPRGLAQDVGSLARYVASGLNDIVLSGGNLVLSKRLPDYVQEVPFISREMSIAQRVFRDVDMRTSEGLFEVSRRMVKMDSENGFS